MGIAQQGELGEQQALLDIISEAAEVLVLEKAAIASFSPAIIESIPVVLGPESPVSSVDLTPHPLPAINVPTFPSVSDIQSIPVPAQTSVLSFFISPQNSITGMQKLGDNPQPETSGSLGLGLASPSVLPINTLNVRGYSIWQIESYGYKSSQSGTLPQPFSTRPYFGWRSIITAAKPRGFYETRASAVGNFPDGRVQIGPVHYNASINIRTDGVMSQVKERLVRISRNNPSVNQPSTISNLNILTGFPLQDIDEAVEPVNGPYVASQTSPLFEQIPEQQAINPGVSVTPAVGMIGRADKSRMRAGTQLDLVPPAIISGRMEVGQPTFGRPYTIVGQIGATTTYAVSTVTKSYSFGQYMVDRSGNVRAGARLDSLKHRGFVGGATVTAPAVEQLDTHSYLPGYGNSP